MRKAFPGIAALLAASLVLAAAIRPAAGSTRPEPRPSGSIIVSAAASLVEAFRDIGRRFEQAHDGAHVTFNFDASSALALQVQQGAPVDVLASADQRSMDRLVDDGVITAKPVVFARNALRIATKPGNPARIETLADLADVGTVALCVPKVPCGRYADAALAAAHVAIPVEKITRGLDARATLTAVSAGDADAAIVYVTDVKAAGSSVAGVAIPDRDNQVATYPIAALADSSNARTARAFCRYVSSGAGQKVLRKHGFLAP